MPTPKDSIVQALLAPSSQLSHNVHTTCPPEPPPWRSEHTSHPQNHVGESRAAPGISAGSASQKEDLESSTPMDLTNNNPPPPKMPGAIDEADEWLSASSDSSDSALTETPAEPDRSPPPPPAPTQQDVTQQDVAQQVVDQQDVIQQDIFEYADEADEDYEFNDPLRLELPRVLPLITSSFLRPFSKFTGQQQSDKQMYQVDVELKTVDMAESFLCGYLKIQGLTKDHPTLTTYFEGEMIGPKHTFQTDHEDWGATKETDLSHWGRFPAFRPIARQAKIKPNFHYKNFTQRENIFMRWKEYFLVPDHTVREINGASFEGFYYICFNQVSGDICGIYFHAKSEKFQQLELKHVYDHGCMPAFEFR
ncbi:MAG: hypothetical protein Q9174_000900 [Haloplaca sp. 1 TL-2023]